MADRRITHPYFTTGERAVLLQALLIARRDLTVGPAPCPEAALDALAAKLRNSPRVQPKRYPWAETPVGGSFLIPNACVSARQVARSGAPGAITFTPTYGKTAVPGSRWSVRSVLCNGIPSVRVTRTA